jgi:hypothetical protein
VFLKDESAAYENVFFHTNAGMQACLSSLFSIENQTAPRVVLEA